MDARCPVSTCRPRRPRLLISSGRLRRRHFLPVFLASSAESVGGFRFWKLPQGMIKCDFHGFVSTEPVGASSQYSDLVVETFDSTGGDLPPPEMTLGIPASSSPGHSASIHTASAERRPGTQGDRVVRATNHRIAHDSHSQIFEPGPEPVCLQLHTLL